MPGDAHPDYHATFCRTCHRALSVYLDVATGELAYRHAAELCGGGVDHPADPAPLAEIREPVMECDFCSRVEVAWVYRCADQFTEQRIVISEVVSASDYRDRHHAARVRRAETAPAIANVWGERWAACAGCAESIESRDLLGLIARVTESLPAKLTRGNRLARTRGHLRATYSVVLATLAPGRGRITADQPLGVWESPPAP
jgi:hypothetical protein